RPASGGATAMAEHTSSSITIEAAPADVMGVIADFESYPEWATEVKDVRVLTEEGDGWADQVRFTLDAGAIKDTYVLDYEWDVTRNGTGVVSWGLVEASVLKTMNGSYTLAAKGAAGTTVTYRLAVDVKIPMLGMLKRKAEKVIIDTALKELKKRVEG
ncbi:MAG TPA: SRPBCC family protein, partial [Pedococcus sp.]|nr:SRPBCC family protein [Pedococcus sp.]